MLYNSGPLTLVRIVEVSVIGGVHFRRFHCICNSVEYTEMAVNIAKFLNVDFVGIEMMLSRDV